MAIVSLPRALQLAFDIEGELEIEAANVRALLRALDARSPGIAGRIEEGMSIAIDGEIYSDPMLEGLSSDAEVHFVPRLQGG